MKSLGKSYKWISERKDGGKAKAVNNGSLRDGTLVPDRTPRTLVRGESHHLESCVIEPTPLRDRTLVRDRTPWTLVQGEEWDNATRNHQTSGRNASRNRQPKGSQKCVYYIRGKRYNAGNFAVKPESMLIKRRRSRQAKG